MKPAVRLLLQLGEFAGGNVYKTSATMAIAAGDNNSERIGDGAAGADAAPCLLILLTNPEAMLPKCHSMSFTRT